MHPKAQILRCLLAQPDIIQVAGAHNGLSARLVEQAGFEAIWASGLEISAANAVPDANILTMTDYLEAARRAGDWLIRDQEPDGSWVRFTYNNVAHAWEVRVSWALLLLAQISGETRYEHAARKNIAWTRSQQRADGWFDHLALVPGEAAVMHTIAYTLEGMLECGMQLNDAGMIQSARRPADVLLEHQRADGALPGAFADGWRSSDHFTCLTGNAQMAIVWQRLYQLGGDEKYLNASEHIIDYVCRAQLVRTRDRNLLGSLPGSDPIDGD